MSVGGGERAASRVLYVPESVVVATWRALRETASRGCEATARWAGPAFQFGAGEQVVTTVVVPGQRVGPGRFEVPHAATRTMGAALGDAGLVNLAQLHTHPDEWVGHSRWDDARAYSTRNGALSIVWPHYGRVLSPPEHWGVHECVGARWRRLGLSAAAARLVVLPDGRDLRVAVELLEADEVGEEEVSP